MLTPCMSITISKYCESQSIAALITIINRPAEKKTSGKDRNFKIGFIKKFNIVITAPTMNGATQPPSNVTPSSAMLTRNSAKAFVIVRYTSLIFFNLNDALIV